MNYMDFLSNFHFRNELWVLILPGAAMAIDFATGIFYALMSKTFKSKKMRSGLTKKVGEISILVFGELCSYGLGIPPAFMDGVAGYILFMETMSILENAKKAGFPLPGFISHALNTIDETLKEEDVTEALRKMKELEKEIDTLKQGKIDRTDDGK